NGWVPTLVALCDPDHCRLGGATNTRCANDNRRATVVVEPENGTVTRPCLPGGCQADVSTARHDLESDQPRSAVGAHIDVMVTRGSMVVGGGTPRLVLKQFHAPEFAAEVPQVRAIEQIHVTVFAARDKQFALRGNRRRQQEGTGAAEIEVAV